jgi:NitT/TauT family transport system substrate-binding protein
MRRLTLLLDWWPNPNHVPLYAGVEKGIFKEYGIDLNILNLQEPPSALTYLLADQVDVALYYTPSCLIGYARAPQFKIIGKLHDHALYSLMTRKDSNIVYLEDFDGKNIGVFGDLLAQGIMHFLERQGIVPAKLKMVQFDPITALYSNTLDIISGVYWNIEPFQLQSQGIETRCFTWEDCGFPDYPELVFIASEKFLKNNPQIAQAFQKALQGSIDYSVQNPEQAFEAYLQKNPEKKHLTWEKEAWNATVPVLATSQKFNLVLLRTFHAWLEDCKILLKKFNLMEVLDPTLGDLHVDASSID